MWIFFESVSSQFTAWKWLFYKSPPQSLEQTRGHWSWVYICQLSRYKPSSYYWDCHNQSPPTEDVGGIFQNLMTAGKGWLLCNTVRSLRWHLWVDSFCLPYKKKKNRSTGNCALIFLCISAFSFFPIFVFMLFIRYITS